MAKAAKMSDRTQTSLRLHPDLLIKLKHRAIDLGMPLNSLIAIYLHDALNENGPNKPDPVRKPKQNSVSK